MIHYPFKLAQIENEDGMLPVQLECNGKLVTMDLKTILQLNIQKLKCSADLFLSEKVANAVISVPSCFDDVKRRVIMEAAAKAGLVHCTFINGTEAAAITYGNETTAAGERTVLILDIGAGAMDMSILTIGNNGVISNIKVVSGDAELGGEDFTSRMVVFVIEKFKNSHNIDIGEIPQDLWMLHIGCERAKIELSKSIETKIHFAVNLGNYIIPMTRIDFENLCEGLFCRINGLIVNALEDAGGLQNIQIDEIVLVGGSTRIPKIHQLLSELFPGKVLKITTDEAELAAYGAAKVAAEILSKGNSGDDTSPRSTAAGTPLQSKAAGTSAREADTKVFRFRGPLINIEGNVNFEPGSVCFEPGSVIVHNYYGKNKKDDD